VTSIQTVTAGTLQRHVSARMGSAGRLGGSVMRRQTVLGLISAGLKTVLAQITCVNMSVIQTWTARTFTVTLLWDILASVRTVSVLTSRSLRSAGL